MTETLNFDVSEFLDDDLLIAEYLAVARRDENPAVFAAALGDVAKARAAKEKGDHRSS